MAIIEKDGPDVNTFRRTRPTQSRFKVANTSDEKSFLPGHYDLLHHLKNEDLRYEYTPFDKEAKWLNARHFPGFLSIAAKTLLQHRALKSRNLTMKSILACSVWSAVNCFYTVPNFRELIDAKNEFSALGATVDPERSEEHTYWTKSIDKFWMEFPQQKTDPKMNIPTTLAVHNVVAHLFEETGMEIDDITVLCVARSFSMLTEGCNPAHILQAGQIWDRFCRRVNISLGQQLKAIEVFQCK